MPVKQEIKQEILNAVLALGKPATIREIEKKVRFERHTLSKYLDLLRKEGLLDYDAVGRAKLWRIDSAPLESIFTMEPESMGFAERVLANLLSKISCGIAVIDDLYRIQFMNELLVEMYGPGKGKAFYEFVLGLKNPLALDTVRDVVSGKAEFAQIEMLDRERSTLDIKASLLRNPDGTNSAILIIEDVTYQKGVERAMRESERKYRRIVEASPEAILLSDSSGAILLANRTAAVLTGRKGGGELLGKSVYDLIAPEDRRRAHAAMQETLRTGVPCALKYALLHGEDVRAMVEARTVALDAAGGKPSSLMSSLRRCGPQPAARLAKRAARRAA